METVLRAVESSARCSKLTNDITVITGHFNTDVRNTSNSQAQHLQTSWKGMQVLLNVKNPVVTYFTDKADLDLFNKIHAAKNLNRRNIRSEYVGWKKTWAYQMMGNIIDKKVQSDRDKARKLSETHLKYELIIKTIKRNPFCTQYFMWMDADTYVFLQTRNEIMFIIPSDFDIKRVHFQQAEPLQNISAEDVFLHDKKWLCTDLFLGDKEALTSYVSQHMKTVIKFLNKGLVGTDYNVLYATYRDNKEQQNQNINVYYSKLNRNKCSDFAYLLSQNHGSTTIHT